MPSLDGKEQTGGFRVDFSDDKGLTMVAAPRRTAYVDDPNGRMLDSLQRENGPNYYPTTAPVPDWKANEKQSLFPNDKPPMPPQPGITAPSGETVSGGTTHVLPPGDMLSPDAQPANGIDYRARGYNPGPTIPDSPFGFNESWTWQVLPDSILYKSYLAGNHESRMGSQMVHINDLGNFWDVTLGGRAEFCGTAIPIRTGPRVISSISKRRLFRG